MMDNDHIVIGVCGGTGSGKTTLANKILQTFPNDAVMVSMDWYYKDNKHLPFEERVKLNYDHPNAFDTDMLVEHIKQLKQGQTVTHPLYDFTTHLRKDEWEEVQSKKIILVEGILIFENKQLVDQLDIKIFVDADDDVRILRRLVRDVKKRGRDIDSIITQYLTTVKPMYEQFVQPSKRMADVIVPEGGRNAVALDMIIHSIKSKLQNN